MLEKTRGYVAGLALFGVAITGCADKGPITLKEPERIEQKLRPNNPGTREPVIFTYKWWNPDNPRSRGIDDQYYNVRIIRDNRYGVFDIEMRNANTLIKVVDRDGKRPFGYMMIGNFPDVTEFIRDPNLVKFDNDVGRTFRLYEGAVSEEIETEVRETEDLVERAMAEIGEYPD